MTKAPVERKAKGQQGIARSGKGLRNWRRMGEAKLDPKTQETREPTVIYLLRWL